MKTTIIVTGATRGIGRAIAEKLVHQGYHVVACARNKRELDATQAELAAHGSIETRELDLASRESINLGIRYINGCFLKDVK